MITCKFSDRLGNNLFQYTFSRLMAEKFGVSYSLALPDNDVICVNPINDLSCVASSDNKFIEDVESMTSDWDPSKDLLRDGVNVKYVGYFQRWKFYEGYRDTIRSYFIDNDVCVDNNDDLCFHCRLGDYKFQCAPVLHSPEYYISQIDQLDFNKLYIVTDDPNDRYLESLKRRYSPIIVSETPRHDFYFMQRFNNVVISNSTYSWWSMFLGNSKRVYIPTNFVFKNSVDLHKLGIGF